MTNHGYVHPVPINSETEQMSVKLGQAGSRDFPEPNVKPSRPVSPANMDRQILLALFLVLLMIGSPVAYAFVF